MPLFIIDGVLIIKSSGKVTISPFVCVATNRPVAGLVLFTFVSRIFSLR